MAPPVVERCARCSRPLKDAEIAGHTGKFGAPDRKVWCEACVAAIAGGPK